MISREFFTKVSAFIKGEKEYKPSLVPPANRLAALKNTFGVDGGDEIGSVRLPSWVMDKDLIDENLNLVPQCILKQVLEQPGLTGDKIFMQLPLPSQRE